MPKMKTRAYNVKKRMFNKMTAYEVSNKYPLVRGVVVANDDELAIGRVKVRVFSLHGTKEDGTRDEDLPWAYPSFFSASYDSGTFIVPEVNNTVWLLFEDGDVTKPVYIGSVYGKGVNNPKRVGNTNGEFRAQRLGKNEKPVDALTLDDKVIYKSPKGAKIVIRETKAGEGLIITDQLGQKIEMKAPFKLDTSIANLENLKKETLLDGKAEISVESVNGSKLQLISSLEGSELALTLEGESPVTFKYSTSGEGLRLSIGKVDVEIKDNVVVRTLNEEVKIDEGLVSLKATKVHIDAEDIYLGGDVSE